MAIKPPQIDPRRYSQMLQQIKSLVPFYIPEWKASDDKDFGQALLHIFSHLTEDVISHLNRVPGKNFIAFLNMLGIELLPARPARVPVRFIPSPGPEDGILIREHAGLVGESTAEPPIELPFETEKNIFAIRSALLDLVAADPEKDAIYKPPPGFTELQLPAKPLATYSFQSFAATGSNTFQLDRVEGLNENDLLRIPPSHSSAEPDQNSSDAQSQSSAEHLEISAISGNIVTTKDKSSKDYPANTKAEKVIQFHLFDSKDWQEHVLYLGHPDLFSIKNEAQFTIIVTHLAGTATGIEPLDLAWEYWGEKEDEEEKDWWEFDIVADSSGGFSSDGQVILRKGKGEIKEELINNVKSRWIRCRLKDKIPSTEPRRLPNFDQIKFLIESSGDPVSADQGFYNDTPLDPNLPFSPFGTEPRMLDRFNLASEEIFSKKGAEITIEVKLDDRGILKTPTAVNYNVDASRQIFKVFSRGAGGKLLEVEVDPFIADKGPSESDWTDHGLPTDTSLAEAQPSAVSIATGPSTNYIWVFARAENGHLVEMYYRQGIWMWLDHKTPPSGVKIIYDPSAVNVGVNLVHVFVVGEDNCLYLLKRDHRNGSSWKGPFKPDTSSLHSAPYAVSCQKGNSVEVKAFVKTAEGRLWEWSSSDYTGSGKTYGLDGNAFFIDSRPFAQCFVDNSNGTGDVHAKVFVIDQEGKLRELNTKTDEWQDLDSPVLSNGDRVKIKSNPHGFVEYPADPSDDNSKENKHIFVIGDDHQLWERTDRDWVLHPLINDLELNHSPFVIPALSENSFGYSIFAESRKNSIVERRIKRTILNSDKFVTDKKNAKLILATSARDKEDIYNEQYIRISEGKGKGQRRIITKYNSTRSFTLKTDWSEQPDSKSSYQLLARDSSQIWYEYKEIFQENLKPVLSWEYWNSMGWVAFTQDEHKLKDTTNNLLKSGFVKFKLPKDIETTEVAGQDNFWIRSRIISGDFGQQTVELMTTGEGNQRVVFNKSSLRPPQINKLKITYKLLDEQFPGTCIAFNNLNYIDQTDACRTASKWFPPFTKLEDTKKTVYLGFEKAIEGGPIKILFAARELKYTDEQKPKMEWSFRTQNRWEPVTAKDATDGLIRQEILQLQIPRGFETLLAFGQSRFWIKGTLVEGRRYDELPVLSGIFPNTTWARQLETVQDEILGSSTGEEKQSFQFSKVPVLDGENVRVLEVLSQEERAQLEQNIGPDAILEEKDELDRVIGTWVLWEKVSYFFDSKPEDRHYKLERALGRIKFGDGVHGQIPPAGPDNIRAFSYQAGGGVAGNIQAEGIQSLSTAIAGVESVMNPVAADGGADKATVEGMLDIGPGMISHRHRAVTIEDFELLTFTASRKIKKVRCLANINNNRQQETGWVTVIIVPESKEDQPQPSLVLRREVQRFLSERCDGLIADRDRINVIGPTYEAINLRVDIYAESIDVASEVESQARTTLKQYFHPLTGGPECNGWDFGRGLAASDIYVLLEKIPGVDHIENLVFEHDSQEDKQFAQIPPHSLLAIGTLEINMRTAGNF